MMNRDEASYSAGLIRKMKLPPGVCMDVTQWGSGERCGVTVSLRTLTGETDAITVTGIVTRDHLDEIGRTAHAMLNHRNWFGGRPPVKTANASDDGGEAEPDWVAEVVRRVKALKTPAERSKDAAVRLCRLLEFDDIRCPWVRPGADPNTVDLCWSPTPSRYLTFNVGAHGFFYMVVVSPSRHREAVYDMKADRRWLDTARDAIRHTLDLDKASNKAEMIRLCSTRPQGGDYP